MPGRGTFFTQTDEEALMAGSTELPPMIDDAILTARTCGCTEVEQLLLRAREAVPETVGRSDRQPSRNADGPHQ